MQQELSVRIFSSPAKKVSSMKNAQPASIFPSLGETA
jgi:hypothetical protein